MILTLLLTVLITAALYRAIVRSKRWRFYRIMASEIMPIAGWIVALLISIAISALSYIIMPKPKAPKPAAAKELDSPVAEAGKPIAVVLGTMTCTELNILWSGDKSIKTYETTPPA